MLSPNVSVAIMPRCALPFHHATLCQSTCFFTLLGSVLLHEVHCCGHDQVHLRRLPHQERRIGRGALRVLAGTDFGRCVHVACRTSRQSLSLKKTACSRSTCRQKVCPPEPQQAAQKLRLCSACKHCLHCMTEYAVGIYTFMWHCRQAIRQHSRFPQAGGRIPDDLPGVPQPEHREGSVCHVCLSLSLPGRFSLKHALPAQLFCHACKTNVPVMLMFRAHLTVQSTLWRSRWMKTAFRMRAMASNRRGKGRATSGNDDGDVTTCCSICGRLGFVTKIEFSLQAMNCTTQFGAAVSCFQPGFATTACEALSLPASCLSRAALSCFRLASSNSFRRSFSSAARSRPRLVSLSSSKTVCTRCACRGRQQASYKMKCDYRTTKTNPNNMWEKDPDGTYVHSSLPSLLLF